MKKIFLASLSMFLLLAGCVPNFNREEEVVQQTGDANENEKATIPKYKVSDEYYQTILPFKPSESRGLVVNNLNTKYDINEFETGLMRAAQRTFDPKRYVFQEGQLLDSETVRSWLNRNFTSEQLQSRQLSEEENLGLNPVDDGQGDARERAEKSPIYLAHIMEHNYLEKVDEKTVRLGGIVIGLALNSIYYYQADGLSYEQAIDQAKLESEGKRIAQEIVNRLRGMEDAGDVPITVALFKQAPKTSVVPGNFFAVATAAKGSSDLGDWQNINEKYILFPPEETTNESQQFEKFKQEVADYFPNFNGIVGRGFYVDNQLRELSIEIPIQFYGKAEGIGFTQFITGKVVEIFPNDFSVQVSITSINGPEALIVRKAGEDEPFVHIYD
ncbi:CamS family sex pheromone protein [Bacillaceae bacterium Marseille-Q3522]|nr:CamS family sex pheromone protein [Bacillaceae bacterium Marseille-Q3522]